MTVWLAGMRMTAARMAAINVTTTTSGLVASANWTVSSFSGRKAKGIVTVVGLVNRSTGSVAENAALSGNITDTALATLPAGYRPPETYNGMWGNGSNDGEFVIATSGLITLRSTSGSAGIANGSNVRFYASWINEDDN